jgi:hypothetical protein
LHPIVITVNESLSSFKLGGPPKLNLTTFQLYEPIFFGVPTKKDIFQHFELKPIHERKPLKTVNESQSFFKLGRPAN